jgi:predicted MFS family arabinose efflux permease
MVGFDLGIAFAGPVLASLADVLGYRGIFGIASFMTFLGMVIFITASSKDLRHSLRFSLRGGRDIYAVDS